MRIQIVVVGLLWVGGFVDALGFLTLRGVYLGNMSGDSVGVGLALARRDWHELIIRGGPVLSFSVGLLLGGVIQDLARRWAVRRLLALALVIEALCLFAFGAMPAWADGPRVFLGAVAMGIQNTSLRNSGIVSLYTTHVTGLLTNLTESVSALIAGAIGVEHGSRDRESGATMSTRRQGRAALRLTAYYAVWILGAIACAVSVSREPFAIVLPLIVVLAAAAIDFAAPLATSRSPAPPLP